MKEDRKLISIRKYKAGYYVKTELVSGKEWGCNDFEMKSSYTHAGSYIGDSKTAYRLCVKHQIKPEYRAPDSNICSIGYCERDSKWFGWSHRALYGFSIGSEVKRGDCAYVPVDADDCANDMIGFWSDGNHIEVKAEHVEQDGEKGVFVSWKYDNLTPNEKIRGTISGVFSPYPAFGKGEWVAKTLEDAKQMAVDFAEGVS